MFVYRIVFKTFSTDLIASGFEGRWNSEGNKVIYAAESIAVAFLENMVRSQGVGFNKDYKIMILEIPDKLRVNVVTAEELNPNWRRFNDYSFCQAIGDKWYNAQTTPVLKVRSSILPEESNFVINATHDDYKRIKIITTTELMPHPTFEEILKRARRRK